VIVRVLEDGQYEIADSDVPELERLDAVLESALEANDEPAFHRALHALLEKVRAVGSPVPHDEIVPSDLALPDEHMDLSEVRALLASEEG